MPAVHTVEPWDGKDGQVSGRVGPAERTVHYSSYLFFYQTPGCTTQIVQNNVNKKLRNEQKASTQKLNVRPQMA